MSRFLVVIGVVVAAAVIVLLNSFFIVRVDQQAVLLQLGAVQDVINEPPADVVENTENTGEAGLKFKIPFVQNVAFFDRKNINLDLPPQEILAADQETLIVDAFVQWRIIDPLQFLRSAATEANGADQLRSITEAALREVLSDVDTPAIISGQRAELMGQIRTILNRGAAQYGISIVDVRVKRADLPRENSERVFARMATEREQRAKEIRAEGEEQALRIRAEADRTVQVTKATAREQGQKIRGAGDAERNAIYAQAYNLDADFFSFYRSMIAYERAIKSGTPIILSPDSEFFRYFGDQDGRPGR